MDLKVVLRPSGASNQFRVGEEIRLEVEFSSSSPGKYLEPCVLFFTSHFGYPQCRFYNGWTFEISPEDGWIDLEKEFPPSLDYSGPSYQVESHDLKAAAVKVPLELTRFYRFDKPGLYRIRLLTSVGLDDDSTQWTSISPNKKRTSNFVKVAPELTVEIVSPSAEWIGEVIRKGVEAYSAPLLSSTISPSSKFLEQQAARDAFCHVGTSDAVRAMVALLSQSKQDVAECVKKTASPDAAIEELQRLMIAPDTAIDETFFGTLLYLQSRPVSRQAGGSITVTSKTLDTTRNDLFAALPKKQGQALSISLATVLSNPSQRRLPGSWELLPSPFDEAIIRMAAANFDTLPLTIQEWLMKGGWPAVRSPLMLAAVRGRAERGSSDALLHWYELDRESAEAFAQDELVRPVPRFSSYAIRLPSDEVTEAEQQQLAQHFISAPNADVLGRAASLLHAYATAAVLPVVLPFIDAHLTEWPCTVGVPALAYLLKVSPNDAESRIERASSSPVRNTCVNVALLAAIGALEPSPVLEKIAVMQMNKQPESLMDAMDAMEVIKRYGSPATKALVWSWLVNSQNALLEDAKHEGAPDKHPTQAEQQHLLMRETLAQTFASAHGWILNPGDEKSLKDVIGDEAFSRLLCTIHCGTSIAVELRPASFGILGLPSSRWPDLPVNERYMEPTGRLIYRINQYQCRTIQALEEKLLQFPAGSTFGFGGDFDEKEILEISEFLRNHGFLISKPPSQDFDRSMHREAR